MGFNLEDTDSVENIRFNEDLNYIGYLCFHK